MKKHIAVILILLISILLSGCGDKEGGRNINSTTTVSDILASGMTAESNTETDTLTPQPIPEAAEYPDPKDIEPIGDESVDVDLTTQSSTVVYSMVYDMMSMPEKYLRKTVKMSGIVASSIDEGTGKTYHACIIKDATACCAQGIEFILTNESDYPKDGETVTVIGEFTTYTEGQFRYSTLINAELV